MGFFDDIDSPATGNAASTTTSADQGGLDLRTPQRNQGPGRGQYETIGFLNFAFTAPVDEATGEPKGADLKIGGIPLRLDEMGQRLVLDWLKKGGVNDPNALKDRLTISFYNLEDKAKNQAEAQKKYAGYLPEIPAAKAK